jgi:hypothetical protein
LLLVPLDHGQCADLVWADHLTASGADDIPVVTYLFLESGKVFTPVAPVEQAVRIGFRHVDSSAS